MSEGTFRRLRIAITIFVAGTVSIAVSTNNPLLAVVAVITGMVFMAVVKRKTKAKLTDERVERVSEIAAKWTYVVFTSSMAVTSLLLIFINQRYAFLESLGILFSYLTMFLLVLYTLFFHFFSRKL